MATSGPTCSAMATPCSHRPSAVDAVRPQTGRRRESQNVSDAGRLPVHVDLEPVRRAAGLHAVRRAAAGLPEDDVLLRALHADRGLIAAGVTLSMIPAMVLYLLLQRRFIEGIRAGR